MGLSRGDEAILRVFSRSFSPSASSRRGHGCILGPHMRSREFVIRKISDCVPSVCSAAYALDYLAYAQQPWHSHSPLPQLFFCGYDRSSVRKPPGHVGFCKPASRVEKMGPRKQRREMGLVLDPSERRIATPRSSAGDGQFLCCGHPGWRCVARCLLAKFVGRLGHEPEPGLAGSNVALVWKKVWGRSQGRWSFLR